MASFSGRLSARFWTKCGSEAVFGTGTAPPWTFRKRLRAESSSRSRLTVMSETRSRSERAETETPPAVSNSSSIARRLCSASIEDLPSSYRATL
jgi:hypothetical protein